jgi:uncharacterized tellurite resistance protein B-like protein
MDYRLFYSELGKLLYAVADADGVVSPQERDRLYDLIRTRLLHREVHTDEYGTNDAWYAAFGFEVAEDQILPAADAFESFTEFLRERRDQIDEDTRQTCLILADRLAESYRHTNLREKEMIQRLKELLFNMENLPQEDIGKGGGG